jgi:addiction module HigA family antidote
MSGASIKVGMRPPHVGSFIRDEVLDELGLSISAAAEALKVRRATLSDLVNEKVSLTPEMALRIEKAFGISMDTLLRMQAWHDAYVMRQNADAVAVQRYDPAA